MGRTRTSQVKRKQLKEKSGGLCALCLAPADDIGEAAHIISAASRGPRSCCRDDIDAIELQSLSNLMWLCPNDHRCIDLKANEKLWSVEFLRDLKVLHEAWFALGDSSTVGVDAMRPVDISFAKAIAAAKGGRYEDALYRYASAAAEAIASRSFTVAVAALISICPLVFFRTSELGRRVAIASIKRVQKLFRLDLVPKNYVRAFSVASESNLLRAQLHQPRGESPDPDLSEIGADVSLLNEASAPLELPVQTIVYGAATLLENSTAVSGLFPVDRVIPDLRYVGLYYFYKRELGLASLNLVERGLQRLSGLDDAPALAAAVLLRRPGRRFRRAAAATMSQLEKHEPMGEREPRLTEAFLANMRALEAWAQGKRHDDLVLEAIGRRLLAGGDLERANVRMTPMYYYARNEFSNYDDFCRAASKGMVGNLTVG